MRTSRAAAKYIGQLRQQLARREAEANITEVIRREVGAAGRVYPLEDRKEEVIAVVLKRLRVTPWRYKLPGNARVTPDIVRRVLDEGLPVWPLLPAGKFRRASP